MEAEVNGQKISVDAISAKIADVECDALVVGLAENEKLSGELKNVDESLRGEISKLIKEGIFSGEWKQLHWINTFGLIKPKRILLFGLGKEKELTAERLRKAAGIAAKAANSHKIGTMATAIQTRLADRMAASSAVVEGTFLGLYKFNKYKTSGKEKENSLKVLIFAEPDRTKINECKKGAEHGIILAESINYVRELVNTPPGAMYPAKLADEANRLAKDLNLKINILDEKKLAANGMNAILAVGSGSEKPPRFVAIEYNMAAEEKIALVGKGITFDSGGLDIKPRESMQDMKSDKAGAATVLGILRAVAKLKLPVGVIAAFAAAENMPSGSSYRPGDIITAYNKKTIEIIDTDAEGRVVLADAVSYVEKNYKPSAIIDLATLTGACWVSLGEEAAGLMCSDQRLAEKIKEASDKSAERVWELPMWDEYKERVKSEVADFRNLGKGHPAASAIAGAAFIGAFIESTPWAHLDIAGTAFVKEGQEYTPKGGTGWGVRLFVQLLNDWKKR